MTSAPRRVSSAFVATVVPMLSAAMASPVTPEVSIALITAWTDRRDQVVALADDAGGTGQAEDGVADRPHRLDEIDRGGQSARSAFPLDDQVFRPDAEGDIGEEVPVA